jgi:hypothetical protein
MPKKRGKGLKVPENSFKAIVKARLRRFVATKVVKFTVLPTFFKNVLLPG